MDLRAPASLAEEAALRTLLFGWGEGDPSESWHGLGLWQGDRPCAAIAWQRESANWAVLWHPVAAEWSSVRAERFVRRLTTAACREAARAGCQYALAYVPAAPSFFRNALGQTSFARLAGFLALERPLDGGEHPSGVIPARLVTYRQAGWCRFLELFQRTRLESRDLAGLNHLRSSAEIIAQFRSQSRILHSDDWMILERDGADLAMILLHERPEDSALEISYVGVVPEARRQGIGRSLTELALRRAAENDLEVVETNVDLANQPARRLYRQLGFREAGHYDVFLRTLYSP